MIMMATCVFLPGFHWEFGSLHTGALFVAVKTKIFLPASSWKGAFSPWRCYKLWNSGEAVSNFWRFCRAAWLIVKNQDCDSFPLTILTKHFHNSMQSSLLKPTAVKKKKKKSSLPSFTTFLSCWANYKTL